MQRIKIPFGVVDASQLETLADLAEEYSDAIVHVTTRQDFQLHFVHLEDTPTLMRRLAAAGITTREACGNTVRNVTACPRAGVCTDETFDVTPYARALAYYLLGHKDAQDFGRKFKISFSGCADNACALAYMHDIGLVAATRADNGGAPKRGFAMYVGGGLGVGAVSSQAVLRVRAPKTSCCRWRRRSAACSRGSARSATGRGRGSSSWSPSSGSTSSADWSRKSERSFRPTSGGRATSTSCTSPTTLRRARPRAPLPRAAPRRPRLPPSSHAGARPTCWRRSSPAT